MRRCLFCSLLLLVLAAAARAQDPLPPNEAADVETLKPELTLETGGHTAEILMLFFSADGRQLVSVGADRTVRFWDVQTGELRRTLHLACALSAHSTAGAAALSAGRRTLVLNARGGVPKGEKRALVFLDLEKGRIIREKALEVEPVGHGLFSMALSPDGKRLATGHFDGASVWDAGTGQRLQTIESAEGENNGTANVAFSPDGKRLAVLRQPWVHVVDLATGRHEADFQPKGWPLALAWSPDGTTLAVGTGKDLKLWDPQAPTQPKASFDVGKTRSVTWSANGRALLTAGEAQGSMRGERGRINLLDAASGEEKRLYPLPAPGSGSGQIAAFSPDGKLVAAAVEPDHVIHLWRMENAKLLWTARGRGQPFAAAGWGKDGKTIAWGHSQNLKAEAGDPDSRHPLERAFDLAGLRFAAGQPGADFQRAVHSRDGITLHVRQLTVTGSGEKIKLEVPWRPVASGTLLPGNRAAFGSLLGPLYLLDTKTGKTVHRLSGHSNRVPDVAPSADGRYLLSAGEDQTLRIWDVVTPGKEALLLSLFVAGQDWIVWTPGGYYAATPGGEKLMGWEVKSGFGQLATFYPAERFRKQLYRPDIIKLVLEKGSVEEALKATGVRGADVEQLLPPRATLEVVETKLPKVKVKATANTAAKGQPVRSLRLLVDGRSLPDGRGVLDLKAGQEKAEAVWEVELPPGQHELKALARGPDTAGASEPVTVKIDPPARTQPDADKPLLYRVCIGVNDYDQDSLHLHAARQDAEAVFAALAKDCASKNNRFREAKGKALLDKGATRQAVLDALKDVRKQGARPGDLLVVFFAGHGVVQREKDEKGELKDEFYLLTCEANTDKPLKGRSLSGQDLQDAFADMPCSVLLLMDACHSAAGVKAFKPATDNLTRSLTDDQVAVTVLAAAMGHETAGEQPKHGLFTQALLEALDADKGVPFDPDDHQMYVHHLYAHVFRKVRKDSAGQQNPFLNMPWTAPPLAIREVPAK
jgi:WD40 repeat protein